MAFGNDGGFSSFKEPMGEINVTPLVDVMLVLLVIFMVTAPMMYQGLKVDLPAAAAGPIESSEKKIVLTLTHDKKVFIGDTEVDPQKLVDLLLTNEKLKQDKEIYLHADQKLSYGFIMDIMAKAKKGGADSIGMVSDPSAVSVPKKD